MCKLQQKKKGLTTITNDPKRLPPVKAANVFKQSPKIIQGVESKKPFANLAPKAIVSCVHSALGKTKAKVDKQPAKVNTGHLLPSGDVKLYSATRPMAQ